MPWNLELQFRRGVSDGAWELEDVRRRNLAVRSGRRCIKELIWAAKTEISVNDYFKLPAGRTWGSTSAVDVDTDGTSIWVGERCGANSCAESDLDPILKFDKDGNLVKSFGAGMFIFPHGFHVDRQGNVWVTDAQGPRGRGLLLDASRVWPVKMCTNRFATQSI